MTKEIALKNQNVLNVKQLLREVSIINKKYEGIEKITGENFNVFRILKVENKEVRMHSSLIASLLDPNGTHGQGDEFLKIFLKACQIHFEEFESLKKSSVSVEVADKDGRVDIVVKLQNGEIIVIENKIYAQDGFKQLLKYKLAYPNCHLIYLTLTGSDPNEQSIKDAELDIMLKKGKDFLTISYKDEILNWLIECRKVATNHPILRETITQYINLIKHLTLQNMSIQNKKEIIEIIIGNPDNIEAAQNVFGLWHEIKLTVIQELKQQIIKIGDDLDLLVEFDEKAKLGKKTSGFWFYRKSWSVRYYFYFITEIENLIVGVALIDSSKDISISLKNQITSRLESIQFGEVAEIKDWIYASEFDNWTETEWRDVLKEVPTKIKKAVEQMHALLKDVLK